MGAGKSGVALAVLASSSAANIRYAPSAALPDASGGCVKEGQSPGAMAASSFSHKREIIAVVLPHSDHGLDHGSAMSVPGR